MILSIRNSWSMIVAAAGMTCMLSANALAEPAAPKINASPFLGDHYPPRRMEFPGGVIGFADVTYAVIPGFRPLTLDVYLAPKGRAAASGSPLVLYIHGGGWANGHSRQSGAFDDWPLVLASLAARGYVVASLNYRLSSEAAFPAAIQDVKSSIRFLRAHATEYGIDPSKAIVWGGSAGGHLAALAATTCGVKELEPVAPPQVSPLPAQVSPESAALAQQSDCVQGAVAWYGIFDFATMAGPSPRVSPPAIAKFLGCIGVCASEKLQSASPEHFIKTDMPPFLLVHGAADKTVDPKQSTHFRDAVAGAGGRISLTMIPDVDHSFIGQTPEATREASLLALKRTFEFIDATFKRSPN
jgi:acetyl esterase/lipase